MKKGEKMEKGYKPWEAMIMTGKVKMEKATLEDTKHRPNKGQPVSSVIVDLIAKVLKMPIEEPLKYTFPEDELAHNFRSAVANYIGRIDKVLEVKVVRAGGTVYVYRMEAPANS